MSIVSNVLILKDKCHKIDTAHAYQLILNVVVDTTNCNHIVVFVFTLNIYFSCPSLKVFHLFQIQFKAITTLQRFCVHFEAF